MAEHTLVYQRCTAIIHQQLLPLKVVALYFDKLVILDPVGASWDTIGADYRDRDAGIVQR
jgi:hypothetical protein